MGMSVGDLILLSYKDHFFPFPDRNIQTASHKQMHFILPSQSTLSLHHKLIFSAPLDGKHVPDPDKLVYA